MYFYLCAKFFIFLIIDPVLNVPTTVKTRTFLPDPTDGSLYMYSEQHSGLKRMPFTIPQLVTSSPCKSSDGILYTGKSWWKFCNGNTNSIQMDFALINSLIRSSFWLGYKKDSWFTLDAETGVKHDLDVFDSPTDSVCPQSTHTSVFIGKTGICLSCH